MTDILGRLTTSLADRYQIERELGQGGMAVVYLARDLRHDRKVALKVLRAELAAILGGDRFLQEIRTTANLQHPHILPLHDSGSADGIVYYVMPYIEGESLRDRITREKQLPVDDAVRIGREVADALHYAHEHGIVHRDIKPENILLQGGHAMVADFGIALAASRSDGGSRMTETGMSLGTPHYMAPEQAMGEREITAKADVYALGCVLYEMLAGEPPFGGPTAQAIIARVMTEEPRRLTMQRHTIPPYVEAAVNRALEKLPADRFASAAEFSTALGNTAFAHQTVPAARSSVIGLRSSLLARLAHPMTAVAAVAVAFAGWAFTRPERAPDPVARFIVPVPGFMLANTYAPTMSPDGSRMLFVATDSQRVQRIWVRHLEREQPLPLAGTENTINTPIFSDDGQWVAFRQDEKIRKLAIAGGASLVITEAAGGMGGMSWSSRGVIAYSLVDTLFTVSADGGRAAVLLRPDSNLMGLRSPHFLPGGRRLLVSATTRQGPDLLVVDLDGAARSLGIAGFTPMYVEAGGGRLLYVDQAGTMLAVPFDARRARVTGPAQPVAENVMISLNVFARYSASRTGAIVYYTGGNREGRELVLVGRDGLVRPAGVPPDAYRSPRFSPDGRHLAMTIVGGRAQRGDVWTLDLASRRLARLTFDSTSNAAEWAPDGRYITYQKVTEAGAWSTWRVAADGSTDGAPFFSRASNRIYESRLAPDGRHIVFREDDRARVRDILIAPVDSPAAARPLAATTFNERAIAIAPDGRWLAYVSNLSGSNDVYIRRMEDGSPRWRVSTGGGTEPRWGPGGRELFFRNQDSVYAVPVTLGAEPRIGAPRTLFGGTYMSSANDVVYDVSPDGSTFAMVRVSGTAAHMMHVVLNLFEQREDR